MVKKIVAGVLLLLLLSMTGAFVLFKTKGDVLIEKFSTYVEETTGEPLSIDGVPDLTFLPSPGLQLGHATWGRPDGRIYISFSRASVSISAKALLTGKVRITGLNADELDVAIRLDGHPKTLLNKAVAATNYVPQASSENESPAVSNAHATIAPNFEQELSRTLERVLDMLPDNVVVNKGRLRVTLPDTSVITFTNLELKSDNDRSAHTVAVVTNALGEYITGPHAYNLFKNSAIVSGPISGQLGLNVSASLKGSQLLFDLTKASLEPKSGVSFTTPVSMSGKGEYTLTSGALKLQTLQAELPGLSASATGAVDSVPILLSNAIHSGAGTLELKLSGSPRELLGALGKTLNTSNPTALSKANITASAHLREGVVTVNKLDGMVDSTPLSGNLRIGLGVNAARPSLSGDLVLGDLDLDALLPLPHLDNHASPQDSIRGTAQSPSDGTAQDDSITTEQQKKSVRTITALTWPELNLSVRVNSIIIKGMTLSEIHVRSEGTQGEYTINPLTLRMFDSPIAASLKASVFPKTFPPTANSYALFSANISASGINLDEAGRYFLNKDILSGIGSLNATLSCASNAPIRTLSGKGSLSAEPLHVKADLLPPNAGITQQTAVDRVTMGKFDKALLTFVAENGVITIQSASLTAPRMALNGHGNIDLPAQTIDIAGTLQIPGLAVLPVRLAGPLTAPRYSLNAKTTLDAVNRTLQEHGVDVKKEVERGLGALFKKR